jgi:uncharacterized membrane protein YphA (DoxX/SURF4 family)
MMYEIDPAVGYLASIALAAIFGVSGVLKFRDLALFEASVSNYRLLPPWMERPFAYLVPAVESTCAAGVLISAARAESATALAFLVGLFTAAIGINLARGRTNIDCGCFGPALRQELSGWLLLRNACLIVLALTAAMPEGARPLQRLDGVTIASSAATLTIVYMSANYAIGNLANTRALEAL